MPYKLIAVSGSPVREGNLDGFLDALIEEASGRGHAAETVRLSRLNIKDCVHCNYCLSRQRPGRYCSIKDDAQPIFEKLEGADIIILASPVYFMRTSGLTAAFIDRLRVFVFGNIAAGRLRNKIGVSAAVSWLRHGGMETTHLSHLLAFLTLEMIPATIHAGISPLGASAVTSRHGSGRFNPAVRAGALEDLPGVDSAKALLGRALELADLIHGNKIN